MKFLFSYLFLVSVVFSNELININFNDMSIRELINITSQKINKNILITENIEGEVDFISNEPIEKQRLLDILIYSLEAKGFTLVKNKDIYRVVKKDSLKNIKAIKNNTLPKKEKNRISELVYISNIEAKKVFEVLKNLIIQREYPKKNKPIIALDEEYNSILIDAEKDEVEELKLIIKKFDKNKNQVYVRAKIVELNDNLVEDIGLKYGILGGKRYSGGLYTFSSSLNSEGSINIDTQSVSLDIPNIYSSLALGASLNLLNKTYALDVISEPSILCLNNKESFIYVGESISLQTGTTVTDGGNTSSTFERADIGLTLKVRPRVSNNKNILLHIDTLVEDIKNRTSVNLNPDTTKKQIKTEVILNNGESVIIGGLIEKKNEKTITKVPFAGDIPLIGELFKNRNTNSSNKNLMVIITPYIVPKNKNVTFVRKELSKLKALEDSFLKEALILLKNKSLSKTSYKEKELHENRLKNLLGTSM